LPQVPGPDREEVKSSLKTVVEVNGNQNGSGGVWSQEYNQNGPGFKLKRRSVVIFHGKKRWTPGWGPARGVTKGNPWGQKRERRTEKRAST